MQDKFFKIFMLGLIWTVVSSLGAISPSTARNLPEGATFYQEGPDGSLVAVYDDGEFFFDNGPSGNSRFSVHVSEITSIERGIGATFITLYFDTHYLKLSFTDSSLARKLQQAIEEQQKI